MQLCVLLDRRLADRLRGHPEALAFRQGGDTVTVRHAEDLDGADDSIWFGLGRQTIVRVEWIDENRPLEVALADLRRLVERLQDARVSAERQEVRVHLVLVFGGARVDGSRLSDREFELLRQIADGAVGHGPIGGGLEQTFVMTPRLHDPAGDPGGPTDATDAWPHAVDRLVLRLAHRVAAPVAQAPDGKMRLAAWRTMEVLVPWREDSWGGQRRRLFAELWPSESADLRNISLGEAMPSADSAAEAPRAAVPDFTESSASLGHDGFGPSGFEGRVHHAYSARIVGTWLRGAVRSAATLQPLDDAAREESNRCWRGVAERPGTLDRLRRIRRQEVQACTLEAMLGQIDAIRGHHLEVEKFERNLADLEQAGHELDLARGHWLDWRWRLFIALSVAMLACYVAYALIRPLVDGDLTLMHSPVFRAAVIAAAAGSLLGALVPYALERWCGRQARDQMESIGATATAKSLKDVAASLRQRLVAAANLRRIARESSVAAQLRWGAQRLSRVRERALAHATESPARIALPPGEQRYLAAVQLRVADREASLFGRVDADKIADGSLRQAQEVFSIGWKQHAPRCDPAQRGLWPASATYDHLRHQLLRSRVAGELAIVREVLAGLRGDDAVGLAGSAEWIRFGDAIRARGTAVMRGRSGLNHHPLLSARYDEFEGEESGSFQSWWALASTPRPTDTEDLRRLLGDPEPADAEHWIDPELPPELLLLLVEEVALHPVPPGTSTPRWRLAAGRSPDRGVGGAA